MDLEILPKSFANRDELIDHVFNITPHIPLKTASGYVGGHQAAMKKISDLDLEHYASSRNYFDGCISQLSPYISHGLLSVDDLKKIVYNIRSTKSREKFIQQLAWREFWKYVSLKHPEWLWNDIEPYKTGYMANDYGNDLPGDIATGETGVKVIDHLSNDLVKTGYLHNHGRMYLAAYIVHWRKIKWQVGAEWFLQHLVDADEASNNFSWQWIASTFSNKPYIFNLDNVRKFLGVGSICDTQQNKELNYSYSELNAMLFPRINNHE